MSKNELTESIDVLAKTIKVAALTIAASNMVKGSDEPAADAELLWERFLASTEIVVRWQSAGVETVQYQECLSKRNEL
jgi:hypothetical protein